MKKYSFFEWSIQNLGYRFINISSGIETPKYVLYSNYEEMPFDLEKLTHGKHGKYRRIKREDWKRFRFNGRNIMVCMKEYYIDMGIRRLRDKSPEEIKKDTEHNYNMIYGNKEEVTGATAN